MQNQHQIEEDEIDLKELFTTIWKYKFKIILFSFIVTTFTIIYALSKPNFYSSSTILSATSPSKSLNLGGLGGLASLAGINVGSSGEGLDAFNYLQIVLKNYEFNKKVILKYNLDKKFIVNKKNLVFAANISSIYNFFNDDDKKSKKTNQEEVIFNTYQEIQKVISLSQDKKSSLITLKVENIDRFLAYELVKIFLNEITSYIRDKESYDLEKQLEYYNNEIQTITELSLKEQLNKLISSLVQKKVLSNSSKYYIVKQIESPRVAYIKEKTKPKRALIVIVGFITSIILAIFLVFFIEFIKNTKKVEEK